MSQIQASSIWSLSSTAISRTLCTHCAGTNTDTRDVVACIVYSTAQWHPITCLAQSASNVRDGREKGKRVVRWV